MSADLKKPHGKAHFQVPAGACDCHMHVFGPRERYPYSRERTYTPRPGQVHGGAAQGIGQAIMEHAVYDRDSGQLVTGTLMDYALPRAEDVPSFVFETRNVRCTTNPLGVKGAGEAGTIGSSPAVMNAIADALHRAFRIRHVVVLIYTWRGEIDSAVRTGRPLGHLTRGLISVAGMFLNFAALARLPLVDATAISFAAPLITVALAAFILHERVRAYRWSAVAVGFAGVVVVMLRRRGSIHDLLRDHHFPDAFEARPRK